MTFTDRVWICGLLLLIGEPLRAEGPAPASQESTPPPSLEVKLARHGDRIRTSLDGKQLTLRITSESGSGHAQLTLAGGSWPRVVVLRMELGMLEMLMVSNGSLRLTGELRPPQTVLHYDRQGKRTAPSKAVATMTLTRLPGNGLIEVVLPTGFCDRRTRQLSLYWIDAYRR